MSERKRLLKSIHSEQLVDAVKEMGIRVKSGDTVDDLVEAAVAVMQKEITSYGKVAQDFMSNFQPGNKPSGKGFSSLAGSVSSTSEGKDVRPSTAAAEFSSLAAQYVQVTQLLLQHASSSTDPNVVTFLAEVQAAQLRFGTPDLMTWEPVKQSLLLVTLQGGNGSIPHIDPAAALNILAAICSDSASEQERKQYLEQPLALWFFLSPQVFTNLHALRLLLAAVAWLEAEQAAANGGVGVKKVREQLPGKLAQYAADPALQQQLRQQFGAEIQQSPGPMFAKEGRLHQLILSKRWWPPADGLRIIAAVLGSEWALILEQAPGRIIEVIVGCYHIVRNLGPCRKLAYEVLRPQDAAGSIHIQQRVRRCHEDLPKDYMAVLHSCIMELLYWAGLLFPGQ